MADAASPTIQRSATAEQDDWLKRVLGIAVGSPASRSGGSSGSFVALQKSRLAYDALRKLVQTQLRGIETTIMQTVEQHNAEPEAAQKFAPDAVASGIVKLYSVLDALDTRLLDTLDEALNAGPDGRAALQAEARALVGEYQKTLSANPMVAMIDANGFIPTTISASTRKTLADLAAQL